MSDIRILSTLIAVSEIVRNVGFGHKLQIFWIGEEKRVLKYSSEWFFV